MDAVLPRMHCLTLGVKKNFTPAIENVKVLGNLNITTKRAKGLSKWPYLKDVEIPDVDVKQVTMYIVAIVSEVQVHKEYRRGGSGELCAVRTVLS